MAGKGSIVDGYRVIYRRAHPLANRQGTVPEHRAVLYDAIGPGDHPCHWCKRILVWKAGPTARINADHLDGRKLNNAPANLVPACLDCNTRRGSNAQALAGLAAEVAALSDLDVVSALHLLARFVESGRYRRCSIAGFEVRGLAIEVQRLSSAMLAETKTRS